MAKLIKCHFKGCSGTIDMIAEVESIFSGRRTTAKVSEIPWLFHTIICPKCGNIVGEISIKPSSWLTIVDEGFDCTSEKNTVYEPGTRKENKLPNHGKSPLNKFLKIWARE